MAAVPPMLSPLGCEGSQNCGAAAERQRRLRAQRNERERQAALEADRLRHRRSREDLEYRRNEQTRNTEARREARQDPEYRANEQARGTATRRTNRNSWQSISTTYNRRIQNGSTHVCNCCAGLWFATSVQTVSRQQFIDAGINDEAVNAVFAINPDATSGPFCSTCQRHIMSKKTRPTLCLENGSIVNIPISVQSTVTALPRTYDNTNISHVEHIRVQLARRLIYRHNYTDGNVRPQSFWQALNDLIPSPLYQELGITVVNDWRDNPGGTAAEQVTGAQDELQDEDNSHAALDIEQHDVQEGDDDNSHATLGADLQNEESDDTTESLILGQGHEDDINDEEPANVGEAETVLNGDEGLRFGSWRSQICKSFARRNDRRAVTRSDYLLYMDRKRQLSQLASNVQVCLRNRSGTHTTGGRHFTVADTLNGELIESMVNRDAAYIKCSVASEAHQSIGLNKKSKCYDINDPAIRFANVVCDTFSS
ncbi:hypothetical protein BDB00DRAFT_869064 [Zychaea mexicana]|uniref:uncharacterized protein n=1 Tax=Zychaea mexicana TaxID=64656 RepID=UPI0022FED0A9|nr:uncharacterized protein BDB00DRAFT_869064 [Zychaea mexicana]KAI9496834.1 hypothetical protein BDB00DRAFT_869064 [Zychaea mexicana]